MSRSELFQKSISACLGGAISVFSDEVTLPNNSTVEQFFVIDRTIGRNTLITIFYKENIQAFVSDRIRDRFLYW